MRLLIVRHGDPDYTVDSLTKKGWREAELLSKRLARLEGAEFFCSPLGRARDTSRATLERLSEHAGYEITAEVCDWLREFPAKTLDPFTGQPKSVAWDCMPSWWTADSRFFDKDRWLEPPFLAESDAAEKFLAVKNGLDGLLAARGYERRENYYAAKEPNEKTLVFFCHFGVESVMLGHLLGISPFVLWHSLIALTTSVTTLVTEEREEGVAVFRCMGFGDISHLYAYDEPSSFAGRFCEMYKNEKQRH